MSKTSSIKSVKLKKSIVGIDDDNKARCDRSELDRDEIDSCKVGNDEIGKEVQKISKSKNLSKSKKA